MTRGEAMKAARARAGLTLRALAGRSGVTPKTVSVLENDLRTGTITTLELLADALKISLDDYIGREVPSMPGETEFRVKYDHVSEKYIVYANGKEIGRALDTKAVGDIIQFWKEKNE